MFENDENTLLNFEYVKFNELFKEKLRNGIYKKKEFHGKGVKIINMGELFEYNFIKSQEMKKIELNENEKKKYLVRNGDLLFARRSLVLEGSGKCSIIENISEETTFESSIIRVRLDQSIVNPLYYYYFFKSPYGRSLMASIASRTAVSGIRGSDLAIQKVPYPPITAQDNIANSLSLFDRLVEVNLKRIKGLEELAHSLYDEWFVHLRFPRHEETEITQTEQGPTPRGWEIQKVKEFGEVITGITPSKKNPKNFGDYMPFIKTPDMHNSIFIIQTNDGLSKIGADSQKKKTLSPDSICVSCIGTAGIVSITSEESQTNQQINSIILNDLKYREFLYFALNLLKSTIRLYGATGATMTNLSKGKFMNLEILCPSENLIDYYHKITHHMFDEILLLQKKNYVLKQTRGLLLPKLISGEIDISDINIAV